CLHLFGTDFITGFPLQQAERRGLHQVRALETSESSPQTSEGAEVEETQVFASGFDKDNLQLQRQQFRVDKDMTEEAIREYFAKAGPIVNYEAKGKGRARLTYSSAADAKNAVASFNGTTIEGNIRPLFVQIFKIFTDVVEKTQKIKKELPTENTVVVFGWDRGTNTTVIKEHCGKAGSIVDSIKVKTFLLLTYSSVEEAAT
ncbi:unnamed protein product, partial [Polarella glacialis]